MAGLSKRHNHVADVRAPLNRLVRIDDSVEGIAGSHRVPQPVAGRPVPALLLLHGAEVYERFNLGGPVAGVRAYF